MALDIIALRAFRDNYIWLIRRDEHTVVVDPGDAAPVIGYLDAHRARLDTILLTHHHADHIGGVPALVERYRPAVFAPRDERIGNVSKTVAERDIVTLPGIELELRVYEVPGHTRSHIAYYGGNALFCGDTLFACGCGRLFEGTPAQMASSLAKLAALPDDTHVYCAHEYTLSNIRFARMVEPQSQALAELERQVAALRDQDLPSVPSTLAQERATNPFLRCGEPAVMRAASAEAGTRLTDPIGVLAAIREWKNRC